MEGQLYRTIVALVRKTGKRCQRPRETFSDADIVCVFYWAVIHDRPIRWACELRNWPPYGRRRLPSNSTMSRRLRTLRVRALLQELERRVTQPTGQGMYWIIDGKPLTIGGCSKDRQSGYGRAARGLARGYKIHAILNPFGKIAAWRLAPMNVDERKMAERLLRNTPLQGYLAADANYDSNTLHRIARQQKNLQLVAPRRHGPDKKVGHRAQSPGRLRSIALLENPYPAFGRQLLKHRSAIERTYGNLTNWGGGLTGLPPWVRTHRRVHRWVQAKLVLTALHRHPPQ